MRIDLRNLVENPHNRRLDQYRHIIQLHPNKIAEEFPNPKSSPNHRHRSLKDITIRNVIHPNRNEAIRLLAPQISRGKEHGPSNRIILLRRNKKAEKIKRVNILNAQGLYQAIRSDLKAKKGPIRQYLTPAPRRIIDRRR